MQEAWDRYRGVAEGKVADYIPALAEASADWFGICVAGVRRAIHAVGDTDRAFSIQSISKPFVFALVCQALGGGRARASIGVNATGLPFNSVMAIELNADRTMNPMVNAGAIATTSLAPGANAEERWRFIREGLSRFAGRELAMDEAVYASEAATNQRNQGIARLLQGYEPDVFRPRGGDRRLHPPMLAERHRARPRGDGRDAGRWRGEPGDEGARGRRAIAAGACWR